MIKKILFFQILVGLGLFLLKGIFSFDVWSFLVGFLFAQSYAVFFLYVAKILFKRKGKSSWIVAVLSFKWVILVFVLYGILKFMEPLGFFIGLLSMPSFFITFAILKREQ